MPTGYTAALCDGEQTFEEFATQCMRAFGACLHMRDDSFKSEYKPQEVSDYHKNSLADARKNMMKLNETSDATLISEEKARILKRRDECVKSIKATIKVRQRLEDMQAQVKAWIPPTSEHNEFKNFMLEQLETTINHDGNSKYREDELRELKKIDLNALDANAIRAEKAKSIQWNIDYHTENYEKEVQRVTSSNTWVEQLVKSLNEKKLTI